jgi:hypothetical protein
MRLLAVDGIEHEGRGARPLLFEVLGNGGKRRDHVAGSRRSGGTDHRDLLRYGTPPRSMSAVMAPERDGVVESHHRLQQETALVEQRAHGRVDSGKSTASTT